MELVATERPFVYFPLRDHWEQVHHVQTRLRRYGAGDGLDYAATGANELARALERRLDDEVAYRPIAPGGAARAAERISELLGPRAR